MTLPDLPSAARLSGTESLVLRQAGAAAVCRCIRRPPLTTKIGQIHAAPVHESLGRSTVCKQDAPAVTSDGGVSGGVEAPPAGPKPCRLPHFCYVEEMKENVDNCVPDVETAPTMPM